MRRIHRRPSPLNVAGQILAGFALGAAVAWAVLCLVWGFPC